MISNKILRIVLAKPLDEIRSKNNIVLQEAKKVHLSERRPRNCLLHVEINKQVNKYFRKKYDIQHGAPSTS